MKVSFDPAKNEKTIAERGISLAQGIEVIRNRSAIFEDTRTDYGEDRMIAYGTIAGRLHVCVYTVRGDTTHIISLRRANDREVRKYGR